MSDGQAIRRRLFQAIDECGETLKEVAGKTGTNYSYLSALRNKKTFDISAVLVARFCMVYNYSPAWILLGEGDPKSSEILEEIRNKLNELANNDYVIEKLLEGILTPKFLKSDLTKLFGRKN